MSILKKLTVGLSTAALASTGIILSAGSAMADPADALTLDASPHDLSANATCADGWGGAVVVALNGVEQGQAEVPSHSGTAQSDTVQIGYVGAGTVTASLHCNTYDANTKMSSAADAVSATAEATQEGVLVITPSNWTSGDTVKVTGSGFAPGSTVTFNLYDADADYNRASDEVLHTWTATADDSGNVSLDVVLPYDKTGNFRLEAVGTDAAGNQLVASAGYYWDAPESAGDQNQEEATAGPAESKEAAPQQGTPMDGTSRPQALPKTGSETADLAGSGLVGAVIAAGAGAVALRRKH